MRTKAEAIAWANSSVGKRRVEAHGYTNPYGAQCLALIAVYTEYLGYGPIMPGYNAIDVWNANPLNLQRSTTPLPGDMFFMNYFGPDNHNYGHTGIVVSVSGGSFVSVDQNWFNASLTVGSAGAKVNHTVSQVRGFLRPEYEEGVDMPKLSSTRAKRIFRSFRGRDPSASDLKKMTAVEVSSEFNSILDTIYNHPGAVEYRKDVTEALAGTEVLRARIDAAIKNLNGE